MEIPNLISSPSTPAPHEREYFFALELNPFHVRNAIWGVFNHKPQVVATGTPALWSGKDPEDLLQAAETTITVSIQNFKNPNSREPNKVVLGLPEKYLREDRIDPQYQPLLKKLAQGLSLELIGFVVTIEAMVHHLRSMEGVPPSVILVGVNEMEIDVSLVHLGKIVGTQTIGRTVDLPSDLEEGLTRFHAQDLLPSRILLYDTNSNLEEAKQSLLDHPWMDKLPFLHLPKVEILPEDFSVRSVAVSAGSEFIKTREPEPTLELKTEVIPPPSPPEDNFGFVEDESMLTPPAGRYKETPRDESDTLPLSGETPMPEPIIPVQKLTRRLPAIRLPRLTLSLPHLRLPHFTLPTRISPPASQSRRPLLPVILTTSLAVILLVSVSLGYWYLPRATVSLAVEAKQLSKELEVTADSTLSSSDPSSHTILSSRVETEIAGEKSAPTTGQRTVGDRAKGEITLYNDTPQTKVFTSGTILTSPSGLKFTLDTQTTVASKSGSALASEPGKTTTKITASSIGEEYNLSSNTEFRIGTFSPADVAAKNTTALTGGTSRKVQAVSKEDQATLKSELTKELSAQAKAELESKLEEGERLIDTSVTTEVASTKFSASTNDQADTLDLALTLKATALKVKTSDLDSLVDRELSSSIPSGYAYHKNAIQLDFKVKEQRDNKMLLTVSFTTNLIPRISIDEVRKSIAGKPPSVAENYYKTLPGFIAAQTAIKPNFFPTLPNIPGNIDVVISSR